MLVSAEFNPSTKTAYISENDQFIEIRCNLPGFLKAVQLLEKIYGEFSVHPVENDGIILVREV